MASPFGRPFPGLDASGNRDPRSLVLECVTTTARNALAGMPTGYTVFDTSVNKLCTYNGTGWKLADGTAAP